MSRKSTPDRYGSVAVTVHWISAILIVGLTLAGFTAANTEDLAAKAAILRVHAPLGSAVLALTVFRICWWLFADRKPLPVANIPKYQEAAAKAVHGLLYIAVIGLALSGIAMIALSGAGEILFGDAPGPLPDFWNFAPRYGHAILARLLAALFIFHAGAALYHQFIRKDRLLSRMGIGR
jgi:cytochrome b561